MKIFQSWFYDITSCSDSLVEVGDDIEVSFFDSGQLVQNVTIWKDSRVEYYWFFFWFSEYEKNLIFHSERAEWVVKILTFTQATKLKLSFLSELSSSETKVGVDIISLIWKDGDVDIDGKIKINENIEKVEGHLCQENIYLTNTWKVRWIPTLLVRSNDVKASHGCKVEKIGDEKLFYLRSRGISKEESIQLLVWSYFERIFSPLRTSNNVFVENILEKFTALFL